MAADWSKAPLAEICEHSAFGPRFSGELYANDGNVATLRTTDINEDGRIEYGTMPLARLDLSRLRQHILRVDDLVVTRTGRVGTTAVFDGFRLPVLPGAFLIRFRLRRAVAEPRFYKYYFNSPVGRALIQSSATGSVQQNLNITSLHGLVIPVPPLETQRAIADFLGALDDKIELNRRMNETLDGLCRVLFARVTSGARMAPLGDLVEINGRKRGRMYPHEVIEYVEISGVSEGRLEDGSRHPTQQAPGRAQRLVRDGDTIWSCVRPNRRAYAFIDSPPDDLVVSTGFATLTPRRIPPAYLYFASSSDEFVDHLTANADGSAYPAVKPEHFAMGEIPLVSDERIGAFEAVARPALARSAHNERESRTLAALRDALLPKLISGELRIRDAERTVEQAT